MTKQEEQIVLVNSKGEMIGQAPKLASHHADTPFHLAFSCYIFDKNSQFLVTRRALSKKVWPGVWSNSVCGHPAPGETLEDAIRRRSREELGMKVGNIKVILSKYTYKTPPFNGIIENEFCPVFFAEKVSEPEPNPEEVEEYKWLNWNDYVIELAEQPDKYSYWSKDQIKKLNGSIAAKKYINNL